MTKFQNFSIRFLIYLRPPPVLGMALSNEFLVASLLHKVLVEFDCAVDRVNL